MEITFTKGAGRYSYLYCLRDDNSTTETKMPEQGIAPHDLIHYVVEKTLNIAGAFYGQLKAGANISFTLEHNELSREIADRTQVWQSEAMVESLQSLLWSNNHNSNDSFNNFNYLVTQACQQRNIVKPDINIEKFEQIILLLTSLNQQWQSLKKGENISVIF